MNHKNKTSESLYLINDNSIESIMIANSTVEIVDRDGNQIKLRYGGKVYHAKIKIIEIHQAIKSAKINIDGYDYEIIIKEPLDQLIDELGFLTKGKQSVKEVKSMMPGLVVTIFVNEGDLVEEGDKLLSLEAMKMENIIKSPGAGVVKKIHISPKQAIEKSQLLISFE